MLWNFGHSSFFHIALSAATLNWTKYRHYAHFANIQAYIVGKVWRDIRNKWNLVWVWDFANNAANLSFQFWFRSSLTKNKKLSFNTENLGKEVYFHRTVRSIWLATFYWWFGGLNPFITIHSLRRFSLHLDPFTKNYEWKAVYQETDVSIQNVYLRQHVRCLIYLMRLFFNGLLSNFPECFPCFIIWLFLVKIPGYIGNFRFHKYSRFYEPFLHFPFLSIVWPFVTVTK